MINDYISIRLLDENGLLMAAGSSMGVSTTIDGSLPILIVSSFNESTKVNIYTGLSKVDLEPIYPRRNNAST